MKNDDRTSRREFIRSARDITTGAVVGAAVGGMAAEMVDDIVSKIPYNGVNGYIDFSRFSDCEEYPTLLGLSQDYKRLVDEGKQRGSVNGLVDFMWEKLKSPSSEQIPLLTLTSPSYEADGLTVAGMTVTISSKEALAYFVDAVNKNDLNLLRKPKGSALPKPINRNGCGRTSGS